MLYNNKSVSQWCQFNRRLKCFAKHCPLNDGLLTAQIERFLYQGRTPGSVRMDFMGTGHLDRGWMEARHADRARLAICFSGLEEAYHEWKTTGRMGMTKAKCREWFEALRMVRKLYPEV